LADEEQRPIFYEPTLREILIRHLSLKAQWMEKRFNDLLPGIKTMIFFDEPSLSSFGSAFSGLNREEVIVSLNECFDAVSGLKGVHCCGNTDWSLLLSTDLDILSFDAYGYLETLALYPKELRKFLEKGKEKRFVIRLVKTRDLVHKGVRKNCRLLATLLPCPMKQSSSNTRRGKKKTSNLQRFCNCPISKHSTQLLEILDEIPDN
jgi:hypothetical protein